MIADNDAPRGGGSACRAGPYGAAIGDARLGGGIVSVVISVFGRVALFIYAACRFGRIAIRIGNECVVIAFGEIK
jgi:hypothetical protein